MKNTILTLLGSTVLAASTFAAPPSNLVLNPPAPMPQPLPHTQLLFSNGSVGTSTDHKSGANTQVFVDPVGKAVEASHTFPGGNAVNVNASQNSVGAGATIHFQ